jgi:hypothetical protein
VKIHSNSFSVFLDYTKQITVHVLNLTESFLKVFAIWGAIVMSLEACFNQSVDGIKICGGRGIAVSFSSVFGEALFEHTGMSD